MVQTRPDLYSFLWLDFAPLLLALDCRERHVVLLLRPLAYAISRRPPHRVWRIAGILCARRLSRTAYCHPWDDSARNINFSGLRAIARESIAAFSTAMMEMAYHVCANSQPRAETNFPRGLENRVHVKPSAGCNSNNFPAALYFGCAALLQKARWLDPLTERNLRSKLCYRAVQRAGIIARDRELTSSRFSQNDNWLFPADWAKVGSLLRI